MASGGIHVVPEKGRVSLQRVCLTVLLSVLLAVLPASCIAGDDKWDDDNGGEEASGKGMPALKDQGGAGTGGYIDDAMAHEQYSERLQQQLEALRKEHDEIFGKGDVDRDGFMSADEYFQLHREAEDDQGSYDQEELEVGYADLDTDGNSLVSLEEWRQPFEGHIDAWMQMADTEAQQEAQIAHYKDVFNQMDLNRDGELDERELQHEMDNLRVQKRAGLLMEEGVTEEDEGYSISQVSGEDMLRMMDSDGSSKISFEEYLLGGEQPNDLEER